MKFHPSLPHAGPFFAAELVLGFHVGFVATSAGKQREITAGRQVAAYYMRRGSFAQDLLSTLIWLVQVRGGVCH